MPSSRDRDAIANLRNDVVDELLKPFDRLRLGEALRWRGTGIQPALLDADEWQVMRTPRRSAMIA